MRVVGVLLRAAGQRCLIRKPVGLFLAWKEGMKEGRKEGRKRVVEAEFVREQASAPTLHHTHPVCDDETDHSSDHSLLVLQ